jgi:4-amino-4-deoxy-L-arabinose transferase-like glycosyltransferase
MRRSREAALLLVTCAVLYLTGAGAVPFYTRGEPREGLVVREMVRTGSWLVPVRPDGEPTRKPPLYYWAAAPFLRALPGRPELALRLPSAILATAAVLGTWATARGLWGAAAGLPAGVVLATSFEWTRAATSARIDMTLAAALTAVVAGWSLALGGRRRTGVALATAGATLGTLAKGPVALVLPALAAGGLLVARRSIRPLRAIAVLGGAAALAGLWYAAAFRREGAGFLGVVVRENVLRFVDSAEAGTGHAHGFAYLVPLALVGFLPWTPIFGLALIPFRERPRATPTLFAASWIVTGVVFFSLAAGKRSVYLLPLYPALALLVAAGLCAAPEDGCLARAIRLGARAYAPAALLVAATASALALGVDVGAPIRRWLSPRDAEGAAVVAAAAAQAAPWLLALAAATAGAAVAVARSARSGRWRNLVLVVGAVFVAWTAAFDGLVHPAIGRERSLRAFFAVVARTIPPDAPLYARFPLDPGLRFYAPAGLRPWRPHAAAPGGYVVLWEDEWRSLRDGAGRELPVLARSEAQQAHHGRLVLVATPVRTDSRSR